MPSNSEGVRRSFDTILETMTLERHETGRFQNESASYDINEMDKRTGGTGKLVFLDDYRAIRTSEETGKEIDTISPIEPKSLNNISSAFSPSKNDRPNHSSEEFIMIIRPLFVKPILKALKDIEPYTKTPDASLYVNEILHKIQELEVKSPNDPFLEILSGFYIALAFNNQWADYETEQYAAIRNILKRFAGRPALKLTEIEKAILEMEEIGFNTTPIPIPIFTEGYDE